MRHRAALLALLAMLATSGCLAEGLSFTHDRRVEFTSLQRGDEVTLPFTVSWSVEDFDGLFALFLDSEPIPPGETLGWVARDDDACLAAPDCPDNAYLATRGAYLVDGTSFSIDRVRPNVSRDGRHEVVLVLLDRSGRRIGESAFFTEFYVPQEGQAR